MEEAEGRMGGTDRRGRDVGGTRQPSVLTHLPAVGVSQRAAVDLVEDVAGQHHLVHLHLALREHLCDKDSAVHVPGGAAKPQLSRGDPAHLPQPFRTISDVSLIQGGREKPPHKQQILARLNRWGEKHPRQPRCSQQSISLPFWGSFEHLGVQTLLQSREEDQGLLPEHHPQRSARDRLVSDAHLEESGR